MAEENIPRMSVNGYLTLEDSEGSSGDLITVKTGCKSRKELKGQFRRNAGDWMKRFPQFHNQNTWLDLALAVYRKPRFVKNQDVDNIAKVVLDALKGNLFWDDSLIARLLVFKQDAKPLKGYNTDSLVISFRAHNPEKQMILINKEAL